MEHIIIGNPVLKKVAKEILYPCRSEIPAHTILADAPINEPLPEKTKNHLQFPKFLLIIVGFIHLPSKLQTKEPTLTVVKAVVGSG